MAESNPLAVHDATKKFGTVQALAGVSIVVKRGELLGLLGPNGAGKTTLIRAIAGRLKLDGGWVRLFDRDVKPGDPRPEIGVVPQELAIYPLLTATENLEVFGRLYGVTGAELADRVKWALRWADLADRSREPINRFSGGMKRRLNLACGLLHTPKLVLLDEPTVGVDPQSRERIYEMLAELQQSGMSIVLTSHHLEEAERRCERLVIIDRGRIVAEGTVQELVARTLGGAKALRVVLNEPLGPDVDLPAGASFDDERRVVRSGVSDPARDVPALLAAVDAAGGRVVDLELTGASLQDVFISLTGRELRE